MINWGKGSYVIYVIKSKFNGKSFGDDIYLQDKLGQLFLNAHDLILWLSVIPCLLRENFGCDRYMTFRLLDHKLCQDPLYRNPVQLNGVGVSLSVIPEDTSRQGHLEGKAQQEGLFLKDYPLQTRSKENRWKSRWKDQEWLVKSE